MPLISTSAGTLFYAQRGASGPHAICIHGAGGSHMHWGNQLRHLSDLAQVYTIDLPGHGRAPGPGRSTIADYSAVLLAWMDTLQLERAIVIGHSMGGAIALWTALQAPERVHGLGLVGTGGRLRVREDIFHGFDSNVAATIAGIVESSYAPAAPEHLRLQGYTAYAACDPRIYQNDFLACDGFDVLDRLSEISCPAAIVCGDQDRMTPPKYSLALLDRIGKARYISVPQAGHMVMIEQPAAVNDGLRLLIEQVGKL